MRIKLLNIAFAASLLFMPQSQAKTSFSGFPKGELSNAKNHTGNIWLSELNVETARSIPASPWRRTTQVQSWTGIFIRAVKFCSSPRAPATTRKEASRRASFKREM
jgi:hypothetical protein